MADTNTTNTDVFEDILNLEDQYYREGYALGVADGSQSGRIEGRIFGLQKGFEKFLEMGKLNGRAAVWEARLPGNMSSATTSSSEVRPLSGNERLRKHVERLAALSDPNDLSTKNNEDDVSEFDDRLKDAKAKATLIARIVGEDEVSIAPATAAADTDARGKALRVRRNVPAEGVAGRNTGEMEDFLGLPTRS